MSARDHMAGLDDGGVVHVARYLVACVRAGIDVEPRQLVDALEVLAERLEGRPNIGPPRFERRAPNLPEVPA